MKNKKYIHTQMCVCVYIYIFREREREGEGERGRGRSREVVRMFSCDVKFPCHRVSSRQSAYTKSPQVFLRRSLDLLWALWGQF